MKFDFNADTEPAFQPNANPDPVPEKMRILKFINIFGEFHGELFHTWKSRAELLLVRERARPAIS